MLSGRRRAVVTGAIQQLKREPQETAKNSSFVGTWRHFAPWKMFWCVVFSRRWIIRRLDWTAKYMGCGCQRL